MGCHALFQVIFPTQGLNSCLPYCRQILYHISPPGSPFQNRTQSVAGESQTNVLILKNVASEAGRFSGRFFFKRKTMLGTHMKNFKFCLQGLPWLRLWTSTAGASVQSLIGELRSHMPRVAKKRKKCFVFRIHNPFLLK